MFSNFDNRKLLLLTIFLVFVSVVIGFLNIFFKIDNQPKVENYSFITQNVLKPKGNIALIKLLGPIHAGSSTYNSTGLDTFLEKLRIAKENDQIKAILLEIDSPGGTVAASQEIYREIMKLKKKKKIVVSMKDTAASGGYYIASAADFIFALEGTITGSIGVISFMPNIKNFLSKHGVKINVFRAGNFKATPSYFEDTNEKASSIFQTLILDTHKQFIKDVAKARNQTFNKIQKLADGRIYSGTQALENKLIDGIGGRAEALEKIKIIAKLPNASLMYERKNPFNKFVELLDMNMKVRTFSNSVLENFQKNPILLILPTFFKAHL